MMRFRDIFGGMRRLLGAGAMTLALCGTVGACSGGGDGKAHEHNEFESDTAYRELLRPAVETPVTPSGPIDTITVYSIPTHIVPGRLQEIFRDSNRLHIASGMEVGITPLDGVKGYYEPHHNVVTITTCDDYLIEPLTHSMPFLVPRAAQLLHHIGRAFHDTVKARGGKEYRIKVTSLLRSPQSVSRLRRVNRAAVDTSSHLFGTTFDISWTKFDCRDSSHIVSLEDLKNVLAEVIYAEREKGHLYAIYERKRGCFHITTR